MYTEPFWVTTIKGMQFAVNYYSKEASPEAFIMNGSRGCSEERTYLFKNNNVICLGEVQWHEPMYVFDDYLIPQDHNKYAPKYVAKSPTYSNNCSSGTCHRFIIHWKESGTCIWFYLFLHIFLSLRFPRHSLIIKKIRLRWMQCTTLRTCANPLYEGEICFCMSYSETRICISVIHELIPTCKMIALVKIMSYHRTRNNGGKMLIIGPNFLRFIDVDWTEQIVLFGKTQYA